MQYLGRLEADFRGRRNCYEEHATEAKFLGVTIHENFNWNSHLKKLYKKFSCSTGILNVRKDNIPDDFHKSLYHILFESHLTYGITVW